MTSNQMDSARPDKDGYRTDLRISPKCGPNGFTIDPLLVILKTQNLFWYLCSSHLDFKQTLLLYKLWSFKFQQSAVTFYDAFPNLFNSLALFGVFRSKQKAAIDLCAYIDHKS